MVVHRHFKQDMLFTTSMFVLVSRSKEVDTKEKIKKIIVEGLNLEDTSWQEIEDNAPLFGEGLGLDQVDQGRADRFDGSHGLRAVIGP